MTRLAAHLNDAAVTLFGDGKILYREPGFAFLDAERLTTGNEALANARIHPRSVQHRFWASLVTTPIADRHFGHLSPADLVSRQLEQMWAAAGKGAAELVLAVPAYLSAENLGLLLGIAGELKLPVMAMVDAAVAATRREYRNAVPVHIDLGLHAATLTRLSQHGQAQFERVEVLEDCGIYALYDGWINAVAEVFVQQSRFDPLYDAETEQMLLDKLPDWLADAATRPHVPLHLEYGGMDHRAEIESLALVGAAAPFYQRIASKLRTLFRAADLPALQVTDRVARLPGLAEMLKARVGGEVFVLETGATARGALARCRDVAQPGSAIGLRRQLPWDQAAAEVERDESQRATSGVPTHLLFRSTAWEINSSPLVVGSQAADGERSIVLGSEMPGISRRHCALRRQEGQCVLEDFSRYGTFLNGHRIERSTVLQIGDSVRIGSPGYEFHLITTDETHAA